MTKWEPEPARGTGPAPQNAPFRSVGRWGRGAGLPCSAALPHGCPWLHQPSISACRSGSSQWWIHLRPRNSSSGRLSGSEFARRRYPRSCSGRSAAQWRRRGRYAAQQYAHERVRCALDAVRQAEQRRCACSLLVAAGQHQVLAKAACFACCWSILCPQRRFLSALSSLMVRAKRSCAFTCHRSQLA